MRLYKTGLFVIPILFLGFFASQQFAFGKNAKTGKPVMTSAFTDTVPVKCSNTPEIEKIIDEAISLGAPIYNEGLHMACYRIYEWAGYKILYEYGKTCPEVERILKYAIEKSHGDYSDTEKAWLMRVAFDKILGVPTKTGEPEKDPTPRNG